MIAPRHHFTTEDMKWGIPVKPESNVFVDAYRHYYMSIAI